MDVIIKLSIASLIWFLFASFFTLKTYVFPSALIFAARNKFGVTGKVASIEYDPNRNANIALIHYLDGEKRYIIAPKDLRVGTIIEAGLLRIFHLYLRFEHFVLQNELFLHLFQVLVQCYELEYQLYRST